MTHDEIVKLLSDLKHRIFPRPFERLGVSGTDLVGVEIGVYKAAHAESLLQNLDVAMLYLVDPYEMYSDYNEGQKHYGIDQDPLHLARLEAERRLEPYANRITWIRKYSEPAASEIPNNLDFVYIDGNHEESFVRNDIQTYFPKVRVGGTVGGHDFYNGFCRDHDGVINAVTQFVAETGAPLQVELPDWWILK